MLPQLAMTAAAGGLSFLSGLGQQQAAKKQNRLQAMADLDMEIRNQERLNDANRRREELGREMLTVEETERVQQDNTSTSASGSRQDHDSWSFSETTGDIDMAAFLAAGEKAGFNPVTWLNSGALSLYARSRTAGTAGGWATSEQWSSQRDTSDVTTTKRGHNAADAYKLMEPDTIQFGATQVQRVPSTLEVVGNAGNAALSMAKDFYNQDQSRQFQSSLLDRQLQALANRASGGKTTTNGGNVTTSTGPKVTGGGTTGTTAGLTGNPNWLKWEAEYPKITNVFPNLRVDPKMPDTQNVEDGYGEIVSWPYGVYKFANDMFLNAHGSKTLNNAVTDGYRWLKGERNNPGFSGEVKPYIPFPGAAPGF